MIHGRKSKKLVVGHLLSTCVVGILVLLAVGSAEEDPERKAKREKYGDKISAFAMAKKFVEQNLKSPGSAEYGWQRADECVTELGNGEYLVKGWVDAQNSFGAKIRNNFSLKLKYMGNYEWRCTEGPYIVGR